MELYTVSLIFLFCAGLTQAKLHDLSCKQIQELVDGHNNRRLDLAKGNIPGQPTAADMQKMIWDDELALKAAKWASRNKFEHNPDSKIGSGRFSVGENLYTYKTTVKNYKLDLDMALKSWFDEHEDFSFKKLTASDFNNEKPAIGHYTQMAWSQTNRIGCAISQYPNQEYTQYLVVCNYGPAGNILGKKPYNTNGSGKGRLDCEDDCSQPYGDKC